MAALRSLVEKAWVNYLVGRVTGTTNIYPGLEAADKVGPCIICSAKQAEEDPIGSGNWRVTCDVRAKFPSAQGGIPGFDALCVEMRDAIEAADLHAQLQAAAVGLTVWGTAAGGRISWEVEDDCWVEAREVELYCAAITFPA